MAKLLISNKSIKQAIKNSVFRFQRHTIDKLNIVSFQKLNINENCNNLYFSNNDYIVTAGTLLYCGLFGGKALNKIYKDFNGDVEKLRKNILGNYTIVIKKQGKMTVFVDENAIHDVYFKSSVNQITIATSLYDLALVENDVLDFKNDTLIEYCAQFCLFNGRTIFPNVFRLRGNQFLIINTKTLSTDIINLHNKTTQRQKNESNNSQIENLTKLVDRSVRSISKTFDKISISMTGGLDSRIILAAFLRNSVRPKLIYGVGNTPITNTKNEDLNINRMFADRYQLDLEIQNWNNADPIDKYWNELLGKYGFLSCVYGGSYVFKELEQLSEDFIEYGYFGEPFRNVDWIEHRKRKTFSLDEFLDDFYINSEVYPVVNNWKKYRGTIKENFLEICKFEGLDPTKLNTFGFQILHNEYRKNADKEMLNLTNLFCYSISILSQKEITIISESLTKNQKTKASFMLFWLDRLYSDLLKVPFYSHTEKWVFDEQRFELTRKNFISKYRIRTFLTKYGIKLERLEPIFRFFLNKKNNKETLKKEKLRRFYKKWSKNENLKDVGHLSFLARYCQMNYILKSLKE